MFTFVKFITIKNMLRLIHIKITPSLKYTHPIALALSEVVLKAFHVSLVAVSMAVLISRIELKHLSLIIILTLGKN